MVIDYGVGRSNEELLFVYGFAEENNPYGSLLLAPPLPKTPADADQLDIARSEVLHMRGCVPRALLEASALAKGKRAAEAQVEDALRVFSVFAMSPAQLGEALERGPNSAQVADAPSVRAGALRLVVRILEQRAAGLAVTGSAEQDEAALSSCPPGRTRFALLYRKEQKMLCGGYLQAARAMLAQAERAGA